MLARVAELRRHGDPNSLGVGVLVKSPKSGQDRRFDCRRSPADGAGAARAGLGVIAIRAAGQSWPAHLVAAAADGARMFWSASARIGAERDGADPARIAEVQLVAGEESGDRSALP